MSIDVNGIAVRTEGGRLVKIARTALRRLELSRYKGGQLRSLRRGMRNNLKTGYDCLLSPFAPVGIVMIPGTLAWGAFSTPFCLLGDLKAKLAGKQQIKIM